MDEITQRINKFAMFTRISFLVTLAVTLITPWVLVALGAAGAWYVPYAITSLVLWFITFSGSLATKQLREEAASQNTVELIKKAASLAADNERKTTYR